MSLHINDSNSVSVFNKFIEYQYGFLDDILIDEKEFNMSQFHIINEELWISILMEIHSIHFTDNLLFYLIKNDIQYPPINDKIYCFNQIY